MPEAQDDASEIHRHRLKVLQNANPGKTSMKQKKYKRQKNQLVAFAVSGKSPLETNLDYSNIRVDELFSKLHGFDELLIEKGHKEHSTAPIFQGTLPYMHRTWNASKMHTLNY